MPCLLQEALTPPSPSGLTLPEDFTPLRIQRNTMTQASSRQRQRFQRISPGLPMPRLPWMWRTYRLWEMKVSVSSGHTATPH